MLVDEMVAAGLSGSRVRNVLNALRSLYTYAIARELAQSSPITNVLLPAVGETPRDRVASPTEFRELLLALDPADAVPFALAGYATARSQEILNLTWAEIDWEANMVYLADEEEYAKSDSAKRPFPLIPQLRRTLRPEWKRQGRPTTRQLVCPARKPRSGPDGGKLSTSALYTRADRGRGTPRSSHTSACMSLNTQLQAGCEQPASTSRPEACSWDTQAPPPPTKGAAPSPTTAIHIYSQAKSKRPASDSPHT
jgi:integrase